MKVRTLYFHLTTLGIVPLRSTPIFNPLCAITEGLDAVLIRLISLLRRWAWYCVMEMEK